ncbi:MAG: hypothetical protein V1672_01360 [Candidatus Diapherotrites archaeon]
MDRENSMVQGFIKDAKRSCIHCSGRRMLRDKTEERERAFSAIKSLYNYYLDLFDSLRRDDAPASEIEKARLNKTLCLDTMDECRACNKEVDKINRSVGKLR